jgi:hypothetical protein
MLLQMQQVDDENFLSSLVETRIWRIVIQFKSDPAFPKLNSYSLIWGNSWGKSSCQNAPDVHSAKFSSWAPSLKRCRIAEHLPRSALLLKDSQKTPLFTLIEEVTSLMQTKTTAFSSLCSAIKQMKT